MNHEMGIVVVFCALALGCGDDVSADASVGMDAVTADAAFIDASEDTPAHDGGSPVDAGLDVARADAGDRDAADVASPDAALDTGTPPATMSFFVTSRGNGAAAGNYGGLAGADARCQQLADAAGAGGRTWRAYLSTGDDFGGTVVHARDRIGSGPWFNFAGEEVAADVDDLHRDGIAPASMITELGTRVPAEEHDILTGSGADGRVLLFFPGNPASPSPTCGDWTCNTDDCYGWVGHVDWIPGDGGTTWNTGHGMPCSQAGLMSTLGSGRLYCFAL